MANYRFHSIGDRLKQLRAGRSQADFAESIGVPFRTYQRYEAGATAPKDDVLERIARETGRSKEWILSGKAESDIDRVSEAQAQFGLDDITNHILEILNEISVNDKIDILKYAEFVRTRSRGRS